MFLGQFPQEVKVIACWDKDIQEVTPAYNGNCLYKKNIQNIMLPPREHVEIWWEATHGEQRKIINQIALVNFESSFNPLANNNIAIGYVQTLRSY
jgi:hypothetical protein